MTSEITVYVHVIECVLARRFETGPILTGTHRQVFQLSPFHLQDRGRYSFWNFVGRCRYQSITQQYLKRCLIKDDSNYMFRPIAAIVRFSSESMVVVLYRIGVVMSRR